MASGCTQSNVLIVETPGRLWLATEPGSSAVGLALGALVFFVIGLLPPVARHTLSAGALRRERVKSAVIVVISLFMLLLSLFRSKIEVDGERREVITRGTILGIQVFEKHLSASEIRAVVSKRYTKNEKGHRTEMASVAFETASEGGTGLEADGSFVEKAPEVAGKAGKLLGVAVERKP